MAEPAKLYMVIPCYNEQAVLEKTANTISTKFDNMIDQKLISEHSRIVFVNDGSKDQTWSIICALHQQDPLRFCGIDLAHNVGHQNALLAGLMTVKEYCDIAITMDADLQDDVNAISSMVQAYDCGNQVVYGVRSSRKTDTVFKRLTAEAFYKFMHLMGVEIVFNHADFRLMSKRVLTELANYSEINLFLRGLIPQIGFRSTKVYYERHERAAGESKYPLHKMISFAIEGITSFSVKPLKIIFNLGFIMTVISIIAIVWAFVGKLLGNTEIGWSSTMCSIWMIGGIQLLCLGIIGEYIGKIYAEVKRRPRYIVAEFLHTTSKEEV